MDECLVLSDKTQKHLIKFNLFTQIELNLERVQKNVTFEDLQTQENFIQFKKTQS